MGDRDRLLDRVENVFHREFCKRINIDHTKCYMHRQKSARKNETQNSLEFWDTNGSPNSSQKTKLSFKLTKKKKELVILWILPFHQTSKRKRKWKPGPCKGAGKVVEQKGDCDCWNPLNLKKLGELGFRGRTKNTQTTAMLRSDKFLEEFRRLVVSQISV